MATVTASGLREERHGDVSILHLPQRLTLGEAAQDLQVTARQLAENGARRVVIDLGGTSYVDSAGIGALVSAFSTVQSRGGSLVLANVGKRVADLLQLTKLYTVFTVYPSVDEAVAALEQ